MEQAISQILVNKEVLSKHPGGMDLSSWYPSANEAHSQLVEAVNSSGRLRVTANSLSFGATCNFSISSSSIVYGLTLNAALTAPANSVIAYDGWLFDSIQTIEVTLANSVIQNQILSGIAMRDYLLGTCTSQEERTEMLKTAGQPVAAAATASASIPLAWLLQAGNGLCSNFPLDFAALNGPMQINITFHPSSQIFSRTGAAPETINAFNSLVLTGSTTEVMEGAFSVRAAMAANPGLTYPIPSRYLNSIRYVQSCTLGASTTLNLNSAPSGMLEAIQLVVRPAVENTANADGTVNIPGSVELSALRLSFGGTDLFRGDTLSEIESYYRTKFCGDTKKVVFAYASANSTAAAARDLVEQHCYYIPLTYEAKKVLSAHKLENLPNYGGTALQLSFTPTARITYDAAAPFAPVAINPRGGAGAQNYTIEVLYICSSILEVSAGSVDLII